MFEIESKEKIGAFLSDLVNMKYNKLSDFVKDYLIITNNEIESVRKTENYISPILKGKKSIQSYHLVPFSRLLGVSCESILTAGKSDVRASVYHLSNYDIAASDDEKTWKYQFEHNKRAFLNHDEYGKTIFDYAIENQNYALIQFMKENELFDLNKDMCTPGWSYDLKDLNKNIEIKDEFGNNYFNSAAYYKIAEDDYYRSQLTAMAVERNDIEMLELIKARETRKMGKYSIRYNNENKKHTLKSELLSIAFTDNDKIIDYFTGKYLKKDPFGWRNDDISYSMIMYIHMGEVAEMMLKYGQSKFLLKVLRAIYEHNKNVRDEFQKRFDEAYDEYNGEELNFIYLLHKVFEISEDKKIISIRSSFKPLLLLTNIIRINVDELKLEDEHIKLYIQKINEIHDYLSGLKNKVLLKGKTYSLSDEK